MSWTDFFKRNRGMLNSYDEMEYEIGELIQNGVDIDARNVKGKTPLHYASSKGYLFIANILIQNKADVNARDKWDQTPLHYASIRGRIEIVKLLLENKADVNAKNHQNKNSLYCSTPQFVKLH